MKKACITVFCIALLLALCACGSTRGRTDQYDGYTVRTEKSRDSELPSPEPVTRAADSDAQEDYVLNRGSMKFHYPDCKGAEEIKEQNRWTYRGTRQSVLDMGYEPCKICNP